jgi:MFS transporter, DHA2 family, multidrug resistance protein
MSTFFQEELERQVAERGEIVRWMLLLGVAVAALMEVIDMSITNVALPHIQGNLNATSSEAAWVVTAYSIANVITMPLATMLGYMYGKKGYFVFSIIGFTIASVACGMANSLLFLVIARVVQGLFGGGLIAKAQAFLFEGFPPERQGMAQGVFGICVLVGPVIGPTLGGWLTDNYDWRWIFFINVPVGIVSIILCQSFLPKDESKDSAAASTVVDWAGIASLSIWLGCLQYVLEKGQDDDWFSSRTIVLCTISAIVGFLFFVCHELRTRCPAVNLRIMRYRSVSIGLFFQMIVGFVLFGLNYIIPCFAQLMLGYTALQAGLLQIPSAIVTGCMFPNVGAMAGKVDARILVVLGLLLLSASCWLLLPLTLVWGWNDFLSSSVLRGLGVVLVFLPLTLAAIGDCPAEDIQTASSLLSLARTLGGSIGIAVLATILTQRADFHRAVLVEKVTPYSVEAISRLRELTHAFQDSGCSFADAGIRALKAIEWQVVTQAMSMSYADLAWFLTVFTAGTLPFCLLLTSGKTKTPVDVH